MSNTPRKRAVPAKPKQRVRLLKATVVAHLVEIDGDGELVEMPPLEITVPGKDWPEWAAQAFTPDALTLYLEQYRQALAERQANTA